MKVTFKHTRPTRAIEETIDTKVAAQMDNDNNGVAIIDDADYPVYYVVKVQVKVWCFWITIWEKHCDISDGDTRQHIINEANVCSKRWRARTMKTKKQKRHFVQLELFPEYALPQGGGNK